MGNGKLWTVYTTMTGKAIAKKSDKPRHGRKYTAPRRSQRDVYAVTHDIVWASCDCSFGIFCGVGIEGDFQR